MGTAAICVEHVGKQYRIGVRAAARRSFGEALVHALGAPLRRLRALRGASEGGDLFWALRDVSFEVQPGEVVGVIGRNGAGKSTLLKILARITEPTTGRATLRGRLASLLEVGTGFHPELTGRENIYLNGAILGMKKAEIRRHFDQIVDFAEIGRFLDTPVKHYSSGMYVRLAFAVAAHLEPDILLVDEVLAVGDALFQQKCLGTMRDVASSGRTVLFVSHNLAAVEGLCQRALLLERGRLTFCGQVAPALQRYLSGAPAAGQPSLRERTDRSGNQRLRFTGLRFCAPAGQTDTFLTGQDFRLEMDYEAQGRLRHVSVSVPFFTLLGQSVFVTWTRVSDGDFETLPPRGTFILEIPRLPLRAGTYTVNLYCEVNGLLADWVKEAARFHVVEGDYFGSGRMPPAGHGLIVVDHRFSYEEAHALA